jgi:hypothetical protein
LAKTDVTASDRKTNERIKRNPGGSASLNFDEDKSDRIVNDVRNEAHLNARRATQAKYE